MAPSPNRPGRGLAAQVGLRARPSGGCPRVCSWGGLSVTLKTPKGDPSLEPKRIVADAANFIFSITVVVLVFLCLGLLVHALRGG